MKALTVVGARPQFVKSAALTRALHGAGHAEVVVHTGQHYDDRLSAVFFRDLAMPPPAIELQVGSGPHGWQTGQMLAGIEAAILAQCPDWVVVLGDTNSTLAGALAASKLGVRTAHVEAGLRSYRRDMPEEVNRVAADHLSDLHLCPSHAAVENLAREGITGSVHEVGDVMADVLALVTAGPLPPAAARAGLTAGGYLLATVHRAENSDSAARLAAILGALDDTRLPVVLPLHPRTARAAAALGWVARPGVRVVEPVGYLEMVDLARSARMILTDSGGLQKEAYWLGVPCVTLRRETEWVETVASGWNCLVDADPAAIAAAVRGFAPPALRPPLYGGGHAAERVVEHLEGFARRAAA
jgi:UDP-N-acetylglucosamine 2-epimerase